MCVCDGEIIILLDKEHVTFLNISVVMQQIIFISFYFCKNPD